MPSHIFEELQSDCGHDIHIFVSESKSEENILELHRLLENPKRPDNNLMRNMIYVLGKWGDHRSIKIIDRLIPNLSEREKTVAVKALQSIGTEEALERLSKYTSDSSPQVRKFIIKALGSNTKFRATLDLMLKNEKEGFLREMVLKRLK